MKYAISQDVRIRIEILNQALFFLSTNLFDEHIQHMLRLGKLLIPQRFISRLSFGIE